MHDTNRIMHVIQRFFLIFLSFATLELTGRENQSRKDFEYEKERKEILSGRNAVTCTVFTMDNVDTESECAAFGAKWH